MIAQTINCKCFYNRDTNGQLVIVGGTISADPVNYTNYTLVNMSNIILFDPRTRKFSILTKNKNK